jgi:hypothetical protein
MGGGSFSVIGAERLNFAIVGWNASQMQNVFLIVHHINLVSVAFFQAVGNNPFAKTATYCDCVAVLQRASQKRNSQSQPRNDSATLLLREWERNLFVLSDLRSRHTWWHAPCIKRWCEHNQYYEQQIRIHLRPTSPVGRKRSQRSRDCSLCGLYSECRLLDLAVRADARDSPSAWN